MAKQPAANAAAEKNPEVVSDTATTSISTKTCPSGTDSFMLATHVENRYMVKIPHGDTLDDICKPSYWGHHAARVTPKSLLTCIDEYLRWEADLRVLEAGRNFLRVAVVRHVEYKVKTMGDADLEKLRLQHRIENMGQNGWRVIDPDHNILSSGHATRDLAQHALETHLNSMNRKVAA